MNRFDPTAGPEGPDEPEPPQGTLRPTPPGVLLAWALVGLIGGWLLHRGADRLGATPPLVTWVQPLALLCVAVILFATAHVTWRAVHVRRERLDPHQAVNRLVLARACAYVGALVGGGYLGYALSWLGLEADLAEQRLWRSLVAALAGALMVVGALLLERACKVRDDEDDETERQ